MCIFGSPITEITLFPHICLLAICHLIPCTQTLVFTSALTTVPLEVLLMPLWKLAVNPTHQLLLPIMNNPGACRRESCAQPPAALPAGQAP